MIFRHALRPGRLLPREQEEEVDVGKGGERPAAVAADGDERQPLGRRRIVGREDLSGGEVEERLDDRVGERGEPLGGARPMSVLLEPAADDEAAVLQHLAHQLKHGLPRRRRRRAVFGGDRGELGFQPVFVDGTFGDTQPLHRISSGSCENPRPLSMATRKWHSDALQVFCKGWGFLLSIPQDEKSRKRRRGASPAPVFGREPVFGG